MHTTAFPNKEKAGGISMFHAKRTILKKINVSFVIYFCLGEYSIMDS